MTFQERINKIDKYFETISPEEIISDFEELGYEFEDIIESIDFVHKSHFNETLILETKNLNKMERLAEEKVVVKISVCNKCNGIVRTAVKHMMDRKSKKDFAKEVMEYNLSVKEQPLLDYRKENADWCKC